MPQVHATVSVGTPAAVAKAVGDMQRENIKGISFVDFTQDANLQRKPDYYLYLFNISPRKFQVCRPPSWPMINFAACPAGKKYELVGRVPSIVNEVSLVVDRTVVTGIAGERFATDLLNPTNTGIDIWKEITDGEISWLDGGTDDLTRRGMFWSRNEVPSEDELRMAKSRMEQHYKSLLQQADSLERENRQKEIGPEHRMAAEYFHYKAHWHVVAETPNFCPNCGEAVRTGVAYHATPFGTMCVIDWQAAVRAGVKTRADVPEEYRWWAETETRGPGRPRKEELVG